MAEFEMSPLRPERVQDPQPIPPANTAASTGAVMKGRRNSLFGLDASQMTWRTESGMSKQVLAALYIQEAMAGREYWVEELRNKQEPQLGSLNRKALRVYNTYHWHIFRLLYDIVVLMHVALTMWEGPYPAFAPLYVGHKFYNSGCSYDNPLVQGYTSTPINVKMVNLAFVIFYLIDFFILLPCLGFKRFFSNRWNIYRAVLTGGAFLEIILLLSVPAYENYQIFRPFRPFMLVANDKNLKRQLLLITRTALNMGNFYSLLFGYLVITSIIAVQMQQYLYEDVCEKPTYNTDNSTSPELNLTHEIQFIQSACVTIISPQQLPNWPIAMVSMFGLVTTQNYPSVMYPSIILNVVTIAYFISFLILGVWIIMSVLLAVVFESYKQALVRMATNTRQIERLYILGAFKLMCGDSPYMTYEQFVLILDELKPNLNTYRKRLFFEFLDENSEGRLDVFAFFEIPTILNLDIKRKTHKTAPGCFKGTVFGDILIDICLHPKFEVATSSVIVMNVIVMIVQTTFLEPIVTQITDYVDDFILAVFVAELLIKLLAFGVNYFRRVANVFDFIFVCLSLLPLLPYLLGNLHLNSAILRVFRILRLPRLLRLFSAMKQLRILIALFVRVIRPLYATALFACILIYSYSVVGVMSMGCQVHDPNFKFAGYFNILVAVLTNFQLLTTSNWYVFMYEAMQQLGNDWICLYFIGFMLLFPYFMLNIVIALVIEVFHLENIYTNSAERPKEERRKERTKFNEMRTTFTVRGSRSKLRSTEEIPVYKVNLKRRFSRELIKRNETDETEVEELKKLDDLTGIDLSAIKKARPVHTGPTFVSLATSQQGLIVETKPDQFPRSEKLSAIQKLKRRASSVWTKSPKNHLTSEQEAALRLFHGQR